MKKPTLPPMTFRTIGTFIALVQKADDPADQGLLYIRLNHPEQGVAFARIKGGSDSEIIYFGSLNEALDDARTFARFGSHCCITNIMDTNLTGHVVQQVVDYLVEHKKLKVA